MVDAITPVSASSATYPTKVDDSVSITVERDNRWVAERQSKIDADQVYLKQAHRMANGDQVQTDVYEDIVPLFEGHARKRREQGPFVETQAPDDADAQHLLSGESERVGTINFDSETPFGKRIAVV